VGWGGRESRSTHSGFGMTKKNQRIGEKGVNRPPQKPNTPPPPHPPPQPTQNNPHPVGKTKGPSGPGHKLFSALQGGLVSEDIFKKWQTSGFVKMMTEEEGGLREKTSTEHLSRKHPVWAFKGSRVMDVEGNGRARFPRMMRGTQKGEKEDRRSAGKRPRYGSSGVGSVG